jgi:hypothetical protein
MFQGKVKTEWLTKGALSPTVMDKRNNTLGISFRNIWANTQEGQGMEPLVFIMSFIALFDFLRRVYILL